MTSRRDFDTDKGWNWLRNEGPIKQYTELIPHGSDTFEVVVLDGWPAKILSNREDGAYCTKDLMLRHPEHKHWFKYIGRLDDTLTQTLGEKTNPVPIELAIVSILVLQLLASRSMLMSSAATRLLSRSASCLETAGPRPEL
jgi:hypothetical protein